MSLMRQFLITEEKIVLRPYKDIFGFTSIGIGRNLDTTGISLAEAYQLLDNDIERCTIACRKNFPWFDDLSPVRRDFMVMMVFQLGISRTLEFHRMLAAMAAGDYNEAANQIENSLWAKQTGRRVRKMAFLLRSNSYGPETKA